MAFTTTSSSRSSTTNRNSSNNGSISSAPVEIPAQHRPINTVPDPEEPTVSYEERLMMDQWRNHPNHDTEEYYKSISIEEEAFYGRLRNGPSRRESGFAGGVPGSFWRTTTTPTTTTTTTTTVIPSSEQKKQQPNGINSKLVRRQESYASSSNNSINNNIVRRKKNNNESGGITDKSTTGSTSLLSAALEQHNNNNNDNNVALTIKQQEYNETTKATGTHPDILRRDSSLSMNSINNTNKDIKRRKDKDRATERRLKFDAQSSDVDIGHIVVETEDEEKNVTSIYNEDIHSSSGYGNVGESSSHHNVDEEEDDDDDDDFVTETNTASHVFNHDHISSNRYGVAPVVNFNELRSLSTLDRSSSDQSTGSLLYCKTPTTSTGVSPSGHTHNSSSGAKSSSLIFPTGVDSVVNEDISGEDIDVTRQRSQVNLRLDQAEAVRFPFKKKLLLNNLNLSAADLPLKDLCGTTLGNTLYKLSLAGNRLGAVPAKLVQSLPGLRALDLSQCELHRLPDHWDLPKLTRLNLSHNRFTDFPEETMLEGLPELQHLYMYGNKVAEIIIPENPKLLSKLETLDLGYNDLVWLPNDLDQLKSLRTLKVMNNFLTKIPMRVCDMDLKSIDVSSNPVTEPPTDTCERGICSMRRYWHCIRLEEQSEKKALAEVQKKVQRSAKKSYRGFMSAIRPKSSAMLSNLPLQKSTSIGSSVSTVGAAAASASVPSERDSSEAHLIDPQIKYQGVGSMVQPVRMNISCSAPGSLAGPLVHGSSVSSTSEAETDTIFAAPNDIPKDKVTVNDKLKVIFVGMAMVGKTSMIKRLIEGQEAVVPTREERTVGVDIYDWETKTDKRFEHIDSRIEIQDKELAEACGDVDVKFSVWDFAGQHVYHATHQLFFSNRALYVLVWDMGATNPATLRKKNSLVTGETGAFKLYDSSDEEGEELENENVTAVEEERRLADRALEHDIDEKVQFWIDCIQSTAPGAVILPVASFNDFFTESLGGQGEAKRRCNILKQRLLKHESTRVHGLKERLQTFLDQNRADDVAAVRLRKLICPYTRPKLIFGSDLADSVVRVSGTMYTGFDKLTEQIIGIGTGQIKGQWRHPLFHGHVGARIPRMRLEVREAVRKMRGRFKVVEWGYFINVLRDHGLNSVEDISDSLHFLTNTGELSYFGSVMPSAYQQPKNPLKTESKQSIQTISLCGENDCMGEEDEIDDEEDETTKLLIDDTDVNSPSIGDASLSNGLSQFVFLNPRWLVAAVACILRHDLDREIKETRRLVASGVSEDQERSRSFYEAHLNCPVITADDACLLWQYKRITKKAADRAQEYSNNMTVTPFEFLQLLLIRFGVFVPIDLSIEKALFGGKEYQQLVEDMESGTLYQPKVSILARGSQDDTTFAKKSRFFFLPSLLGPCEPSEAWTYKTTDSWKTTLCHSIIFPDSVPPGLMERLTASVLSSIYDASSNITDTALSANADSWQNGATFEGRLFMKEILCWRTAFYVKIGMQVTQLDGTLSESVVEIFTHLAGRESHLCVGSDFMGVGTRKLITCGRGQAGDGARKIWKGGYLLVCKCIHRVVTAYQGLEFERQGVCPDCLRMKTVSEASSWDIRTIRSAVFNSEDQMRCQHGHQVDTRLVAGPFGSLAKPKRRYVGPEHSGVSINSLKSAVVVVGLWDGKTRTVVRVGSGFIVDKKRGLIVTAVHTLVNIGSDAKYPFGVNYYGLSRGKVVIGVLPRIEGDDSKDVAVFRYFAHIVTKDPCFDQGECHVDACVLRITTRMENDVLGDGEGCGDQPEILLLNNPRMLRKEDLPTLKLQEKCELEEIVRIVGYNQGGGGLLGQGVHLNRYVDFAKGYVCMKFLHDETLTQHKEMFKPREEIVVICPTIGGHSGGPCVNQQGEVIGILSRADPAENQRCYLVPASELKVLVNKAKQKF